MNFMDYISVLAMFLVLILQNGDLKDKIDENAEKLNKIEETINSQISNEELIRTINSDTLDISIQYN